MYTHIRLLLITVILCSLKSINRPAAKVSTFQIECKRLRDGPRHNYPHDVLFDYYSVSLLRYLETLAGGPWQKGTHATRPERIGLSTNVPAVSDWFSRFFDWVTQIVENLR